MFSLLERIMNRIFSSNKITDLGLKNIDTSSVDTYTTKTWIDEQFVGKPELVLKDGEEEIVITFNELKRIKELLMEKFPEDYI